MKILWLTRDTNSRDALDLRGYFNKTPFEFKIADSYECIDTWVDIAIVRKADAFFKRIDNIPHR